MLKDFFKKIYNRFVILNDSPQKIAFGISIGFFCGIMPGIGPIASIFIAAVLKANKAAALLGSIISNTWISFISFLISLKAGSLITGLDWKGISQKLSAAIAKNDWAAVFKSTTTEVFFTIILGYFIVSIVISVLAGLISLLIAWAIEIIKHKKPK